MATTETTQTIRPTKPWLLQRLKYTEQTWNCRGRAALDKWLADIDVAQQIRILTEDDTQLSNHFRAALGFDYMGSVEYEMSSIPECLELFRATKHDHVNMPVDVKVTDKSGASFVETFSVFGPKQTIHTMYFALLQELYRHYSPAGRSTLATLRFKARTGIGNESSALYLSRGLRNSEWDDRYEGPSQSDQVGVLDLQNACFCFWDAHVSMLVQRINYGDFIAPKTGRRVIDITDNIDGYESVDAAEKTVSRFLKGF